MLARLLVVLFALIVVAAGVAVGYRVLGDSTPLLGGDLSQLTDPMAPVDPQDTTPQVITVKPGATAGEIGANLQQRGLIRSALAFRLAAEQAGVGSSLAAGDYELNRSMSTNAIIQVLASGQVKRGLLATIPEGWRSEQIADRLDATGFAARDDFLHAVAAPPSVPGVDLLGPAPPPRLEGYLFPETYEVPQKVSGPQAAEMMVRMFSQRVGGVIRSQPESKLTPHQVLTLASIVEREARQPAERPVIASVYLNRLAANLPLQADPTVQYALATRDGPAASAYHYWKQDLTPADLQIDSPFNTYMIAGLPPGPICNPGEPSIRAVLQPAKTDYLYFVATTDGSGTHLFARTLSEHNANVDRVNGR
ncbi:MAG TPA: endolytic transglycosylase MltG [Chloroflexota bacterium]|nr:endolytic transglycosylase MltG [Chloroflexota bacterium]